MPTDPVSIAVALADKFDTLVGFWAIDEKPTGSKDPYALRRAALGVIRIVLERPAACDSASCPTCDRYHIARQGHSRRYRHDCRRGAHRDDISRVRSSQLRRRDRLGAARLLRRPAEGASARAGRAPRSGRRGVRARRPGRSPDHRPPRRGARQIPRHRGRQEPARRHKRATNIIRIEEKKDNKSYTGAPDAKPIKQPEEKALADAIAAAKKDAAAAVAKEDFAAAMAAIAKLRPAVDAFFDKVTVNVDDTKLRENRLKLLNEIREATRAVADFSKIEG